jgi:hypothetical protein
MPRVAPEPELMDIQEIAAEPEMAEEHEEEAEQEEEADDQPDEEKQEETITLRAADFYALQDTLEDIRFHILDIQRDARQDRLELQDMLQDILSRLPPASGTSPLAPGASSAPSQ